MSSLLYDYLGLNVNAISVMTIAAPIIGAVKKAAIIIGIRTSKSNITVAITSIMSVNLFIFYRTYCLSYVSYSYTICTVRCRSYEYYY